LRKFALDGTYCVKLSIHSSLGSQKLSFLNKILFIYLFIYLLQFFVLIICLWYGSDFEVVFILAIFHKEELWHQGCREGVKGVTVSRGPAFERAPANIRKLLKILIKYTFFEP
jgi:hypothetical protein